MNGAPAPLLTGCRHCKLTWPPVIPLVGQPIDAAYMQLAMKLCEHLQQKHEKVFTKAYANQLPVQVRLAHLFYLNEFQSSDPELARYRDVSRHAIWSMLRKAQISDATIDQWVSSLTFPAVAGPLIARGQVSDGPPMIKAEDAIRLLKEVRDVLEERGLYPETKE